MAPRKLILGMQPNFNQIRRNVERENYNYVSYNPTYVEITHTVHIYKLHTTIQT